LNSVTMKTNTITRTAAPALFLIAWLLLPQTAQCFYNPSTGRWLSRDPIGEKGGPSLHGFVLNDAVGHMDYLGLLFSGQGNNAAHHGWTGVAEATESPASSN
jgi:hypothetical protein